MTSNQRPVLKVDQLQVHYGSIKAIKGISFEIYEKEIISLIGSNGAGKTSTLRAISGIVDCKGRLELDGQDIISVPAHLRVGMGISQSPEGRGVFPQLTVTENLEMGAYLRKDKTAIKKDMQNSFELFPRLYERRNQMAGTMSGGEQQMLSICRALMSKPRILLLDEPSLGLAPLIVAQIFEIIKKLNQDGMTILLVEQNATMALKVSHRAYVLETGSITLSGTGHSLLHNEDVKRSYLGI